MEVVICVDDPAEDLPAQDLHSDDVYGYMLSLSKSGKVVSLEGHLAERCQHAGRDSRGRDKAEASSTHMAFPTWSKRTPLASCRNSLQIQVTTGSTCLWRFGAEGFCSKVSHATDSVGPRTTQRPLTDSEGLGRFLLGRETWQRGLRRQRGGQLGHLDW